MLIAKAKVANTGVSRTRNLNPENSPTKAHRTNKPGNQSTATMVRATLAIARDSILPNITGRPNGMAPQPPPAKPAVGCRRELYGDQALSYYRRPSRDYGEWKCRHSQRNNCPNYAEATLVGLAFQRQPRDGRNKPGKQTEEASECPKPRVCLFANPKKCAPGDVSPKRRDTYGNWSAYYPQDCSTEDQRPSPCATPRTRTNHDVPCPYN
jgi:hypothetical protein